MKSLWDEALECISGVSDLPFPVLYAQVKQMLELLIKQYAEKEKELQAFVREFGITQAPS